MFKLLAVAVSLLSLQVFAQDVLRMTDGAGLTCKSQFDVFNSQRQNVYLVTGVEVDQDEDIVEVSADIAFVECVKTEEGFKFQKLENRLSTYSYEAPNGETVTITDSKREIVAYNQSYSIIAKTDITANNSGEQTVKLSIPVQDIEANIFSRAQERGTHFTTLMLRTKTSMSVGENDLGSRIIAHGSFRVFFDLLVRASS